MRRFALCLVALLSAAPTVLAQAQAPAPLPPHAWLFGTWTGGIFPVSPGFSPQSCFSQPVVVFTRDLVMRATLTEQTLTEREVQTVRGTPTGMEFRFVGQTPSVLGSGPPPLTGFGCDSPDVLHVQRRGENEIAFPGCADFPNPLIRCQTR